MLIDPIYLDEQMLDGFIAFVEDGLRTSGTERSKHANTKSGKLSARVAEGQMAGSTETEHTYTREDHPTARLGRLIDAADQDSGRWSWIDVMDPDAEFPSLQAGVTVGWECDMYEHEGIGHLAESGGLASQLDLLEQLAPAAKSLGLPFDGLPSVDEQQAMRTALRAIGPSARVAIGEDLDTDWKIVGSLENEWLRGDTDIDGRFRVISKVVRVVNQGSSFSLALLPGVRLGLNREQRRQRARESNPDDPLTIAGPLIEVRYLAIYR